MWYTEEYKRLRGEREKEMMGSKLPLDEQVAILIVVAYACLVMLFPPLWYLLYIRKKRWYLFSRRGD